MLRNFGAQTKQIFFGNLLLVLCCAFYLAWWLLVFNPVNPAKGIQTIWLLLLAFAAGAVAVLFTVRGFGAAQKPGLFPAEWVLWGGIAVYAVLLAVTGFLLHRPVTTELFLIVGWAMLALAEVSALFGGGALGRGCAVTLAAVIAVSAAVSLVCYLLYYQLSAKAGFLAGTVPLLLVALVMAGIDLAILKKW